MRLEIALIHIGYETMLCKINYFYTVMAGVYSSVVSNCAFWRSDLCYMTIQPLYLFLCWPGWYMPDMWPGLDDYIQPPPPVMIAFYYLWFNVVSRFFCFLGGTWSNVCACVSVCACVRMYTCVFLNISVGYKSLSRAFKFLMSFWRCLLGTSRTSMKSRSSRSAWIW